MTLTASQTLILILVIALGTIITRTLPFIIFPAGRKTPKYIVYLGKVLPYAVIGFLVVYCLKGINPQVFPFGLPEGIAIIFIVILHYWKNNSLLSIGAGTFIYMVMVQFFFQ